MGEGYFKIGMCEPCLQVVAYRGSLEMLVQHYKGKGGLTTKMRQRLTSSARCAIKMRSGEKDRHPAGRKLQRNSPRHCFGLHDNCSADVCTTVRERQNQETEMQSGVRNPDLQDEDEDVGSLSDVTADQASTYKITSIRT